MTPIPRRLLAALLALAAAALLPGPAWAQAPERLAGPFTAGELVHCLVEVLGHPSQRSA